MVVITARLCLVALSPAIETVSPYTGPDTVLPSPYRIEKFWLVSTAVEDLLMSKQV
jgi:hypothetical protein